MLVEDLNSLFSLLKISISFPENILKDISKYFRGVSVSTEDLCNNVHGVRGAHKTPKQMYVQTKKLYDHLSLRRLVICLQSRK